jgi:hypothetical protein
VERFVVGEVVTGSAYETGRAAARARLASTAGLRRLDLGGDLVLVFHTRDTVRAALQELLRADRVTDGERIAAESAAFAELLGGDHDLVATLHVDISDPVALADRIAELLGIGDVVWLEVGGDRVAAVTDPGDGVSGAFHLRFPLGAEHRAILIEEAEATVTVDHPAFRANVTLSAEQVRAIAADLQR